MNEEEKSLAQRAVEALERIAENYPPVISRRIFSADTDVVAAGTALTIIRTIDWRHWAVKISALYADARENCDYEWRFAGSVYKFNDIEFDFGARADEEAYKEIVLTITNPTTTNWAIGHYVRGWAVSKKEVQDA